MAAITFYTDSLVGYGGFFQLPEKTDSGFATSLPIFASYKVKRFKAIDLQLGLAPKYLAAYTVTDDYALLGIYPALRIQLSRIFIGAGATTLVWDRTPSKGFGIKQNVLAYYGEAGLLWPITQDFSMGMSATAAFVDSGQDRLYGPVIEGNFLMRFYLGGIGKERGSSESNEFKGWRYPFGRMK
jgi:hypothetical protein